MLCPDRIPKDRHRQNAGKLIPFPKVLLLQSVRNRDVLRFAFPVNSHQAGCVNHNELQSILFDHERIPVHGCESGDDGFLLELDLQPGKQEDC